MSRWNISGFIPRVSMTTAFGYSATLTTTAGISVSWISDPVPVFVEGSTTPFALGAYISGYNAGTDTISLAPGSASLPGWLTLSSNQLVPNGTQVDANDFSGLRLRVTRTGAPSPADTGSLNVTVVSGSLTFNTPTVSFVAGSFDSFDLAPSIPDYSKATDSFAIVDGPSWLTCEGSELRPNGTQTVATLSNLRLRAFRLGQDYPVDVNVASYSVTANTPSWHTIGVSFTAGKDDFFLLAPYVKNYNPATDVITFASGTLPASITFSNSSNIPRLIPSGTTAGQAFTNLVFNVSRSGGAPVASSPVSGTVSAVGTLSISKPIRPVFAHKVASEYLLYPFMDQNYDALTDTITLAAASRPLPPWLTLSGNKLIANGTQTFKQSAGGFFFTYTRSGGTATTSSQVAITVADEEIYGASEIQYTGYIPSNQGDPSAFIDYGKHSKAVEFGDLAVFYSGDLEGQLKLPLDGYVPIGSSGSTLVAPVTYDFSNNGNMGQLISAFGNLADGYAPYRMDGVTWVAIPADDAFLVIPGQQAAYTGGGDGYDPHGIMASGIGKVGMLKRISGVWHWIPGTHARDAGEWPGEHFGGAYYEGLPGETGIKRSVYLQIGIGSTYGGLKRYDIDAQTFENIALLPTTGDFPNVGNLGPELVTYYWPQAMVGPILVCFDGFRGKIVGIDVRQRPNPTPYVIADVPYIFDGVNGEPDTSIEMTLVADNAHSKVYLITSAGYYLSSGKAGIYEVTIPSPGIGGGMTRYHPFPREITNPQDQSFTEATYVSARDKLVFTGNPINRTWGKRILLGSHNLPWLGAVGEVVNIPNSTMLPIGVSTFGPDLTDYAERGYTGVSTGNEVLPYMRANKNGITPTLSNGTPAGLGGRTANQVKLNFGGGANNSGRFDGSSPSFSVPWGDSGCLDNSIWECVHGVAIPYWKQSVRGCHFSLVKNDPPGTGLERNLQAGDDDRYWKNLDGSQRGGHRYWNEYIVSKYSHHVSVGSNQMSPTDSGRAYKISAADRKTRKWIKEDQYPHPPRDAAMFEPFRCQDLSNENIIMHNNDWLDILNVTTKTYTSHRIRSDSYNTDDAVGAMDYTNNKYLMCYWDASIVATDKNHWIIVNPTTGAVTEVTGHTGPYANVALYNPADAYLSWPRVCGMQWVQEWNKFAFFKDDGYIYQIEIVGTTLNWTRWVTTGITLPAGGSTARNGGGYSVYTNFYYVRNPRLPATYFTWSRTDFLPLMAIAVYWGPVT